MSWSPLMRGIIMSVTIASGGRASAARPASPSGAVVTSELGGEDVGDEAAHLGVVLDHEDARLPALARQGGRRRDRSSSTTLRSVLAAALARARPDRGSAGRPRREVDGEQRAALRRVAELDPAAVQLHEVLHDREAEAGAARPPRRLVFPAREAGEHRSRSVAATPGPLSATSIVSPRRSGAA